jgi:hypothetical protein
MYLARSSNIAASPRAAIYAGIGKSKSSRVFPLWACNNYSTFLQALVKDGLVQLLVGRYLFDAIGGQGGVIIQKGTIIHAYVRNDAEGSTFW